MYQAQSARHLEEKEQAGIVKQHQEQTITIRRRISKGEKLLWSLAGLVILFLAIMIVSNQAKLFVAEKDMNHLQNQVDQQARTNQQLKAETADLSSPERIVKYAKEKLGLNLNVKNVKMLP